VDQTASSWGPAPAKRTLTERFVGPGRDPSAGQLIDHAQLYLKSSERDALAALEAAVSLGDANAAARAWSNLSLYLAIVEQCLKDAEAMAEDAAFGRRVADDVLASRSLRRQIHARGLRMFSQVDPGRAVLSHVVREGSVRERPMVGPGYGGPLPLSAELRADAEPLPRREEAPDRTEGHEIAPETQAATERTTAVGSTGRPPGGQLTVAPLDDLGRASQVSVQARGRLPEAGTSADGTSVQERAAAGVVGPGSPLPHRDRIQAAFGRHNIIGVEAHVDGAAAEAAGDIGAEAYATGHHVAFAREPDLHTAAHEAAHVIQQRGGVQLKDGVGQVGDAYEQHADRVADAVVAGGPAEAILDELAPSGRSGAGAAPAVQRRPTDAPARPVNAALYLQLNTTEAKEAIARHLRSVRWPEPDARLAWRSRSAFLGELLRSLDGFLPGFDPPTILQKLAFPADPLATIDDVRPLSGVQKPSGENVHVGGRVGPPDWQPVVGTAIAQDLEAAIDASLARLGPCWLEAAERIHGSAQGEEIDVPYAALATSHWMDRAVGRAMAERGVFRMRPPAKAAAAARRQLGHKGDGEKGHGSVSPLRPVQLEWQGARSPELWNFVRALRPVDASAPEVAAQLFGDGAREEYGEPASFLAYGITAVPPLFGVPPRWAKNFDQARSHAPANGDPPDDTFGAQYAAVARSKVGDEVALAQAAHPPRDAGRARPTTASAPSDVRTLLDLLADSEAQSTHLAGALGPWGLSGPLAIALDWIHRKEGELVGADPDARSRWAPVLVQQKINLSSAGAGVMQVLRAAAEMGVVDPKRGDAGPLRSVLHTYAHAAATSHLVDTSRELIARAAQQQAQLPLVALRAASRELGASMVMLDGTTSAGDPAAQELSAAGFQAQQGAREISSKLMAGGKVSPDELEDAMLSAGELTLRARIAALGEELTLLEATAREARAGLSGEMAAAFSSDFRDLAPTCTWIRHEIDWVAGRMTSAADGGIVAASDAPLEQRAALGRKERRDRLALAQTRFATIAQKESVADLLRKGAETVQWQAFRKPSAIGV